MNILEVRAFTKFWLWLSPLAVLNRGAQAIDNPSLATIGALASTLGAIVLFASWMHATKGYALFAKNHGEL